MNGVEKLQPKILDMQIEELRDKLNRQENIAGKEALEISRKLDQLIVAAMKLNGYW